MVGEGLPSDSDTTRRPLHVCYCSGYQCGYHYAFAPPWELLGASAQPIPASGTIRGSSELNAGARANEKNNPLRRGRELRGDLGPPG